MLQRNSGFKSHSSAATAQSAGREMKLAQIDNLPYYLSNLYFTRVNVLVKG